ncbi:TPA: glycoside hydrolase family protein [Enterobacter asburiae]|nr:glycoside hydrolase family protein [Enterobacter asburiae]HDR2799076.1 glycoside hydrolase family protein [Enterobacter asburiae]
MSDLKQRLIQLEGSIPYQTKLGYFKNNRFYTYIDSEGFSTIGYGRLLKKGESYPNGITQEQADKMLDEDIQTAIRAVSTLGIELPPDWKDFMIIMTFNIGIGGVRNFKKMLKALTEKNYPVAVQQAKDSKWYRQVPNRVNEMISKLQNK